MALSPLIASPQLAGLLNISIRTLERWRLEGIGPTYVKAGRRVLYRRGDVERWLAEGTRHSTSDDGGHRDCWMPSPTHVVGRD
jgi:phage terminase Nu1 subunit (DNA packaging protein)